MEYHPRVTMIHEDDLPLNLDSIFTDDWLVPESSPSEDVLLLPEDLIDLDTCQNKINTIGEKGTDVPNDSLQLPSLVCSSHKCNVSEDVIRCVESSIRVNTRTEKTEEEREEYQRKRKQQIADCARKYRRRRKEELLYLRNKVVDLEYKLNSLQDAKCPETAWKEEARRQTEQFNKAQEENKKLRHLMTQQLGFVNKLHNSILHQRQSKSIPPSIKSSGIRYLGILPKKRVEQMHVIANTCYMGLMDAMMSMGMHNITKDYQDTQVHSMADGTLLVKSCRHRRYFGVPLHALVNFGWNMIRGLTYGMDPDGPIKLEVLEFPDPDLFYLKIRNHFTAKYGFASEEAQHVVKRYQEKNRTVFILTTVDKDDLYPIVPTNIYSMINVWLIFEDIPNTDGISIKLLRTSHMSLNKQDNVQPGQLTECAMSSDVKVGLDAGNAFENGMKLLFPSFRLGGMPWGSN